MKFEIKRKIFIDAISKVLKVINNKGYIPQLNGVFFDLNLDNLKIIGSDGITSTRVIITKINIKIENQGKFLASPQYLMPILKKIADEYLIFEIIEKNILSIRSTNFNSTINLMDSTKYPNIDFKNEGKSIKINALNLSNAIKKSIIAINPNEQRTILTGINLKIENNLININTTDSFRVVSIKETLKKNNFDENINITIPYNFANTIQKIIYEQSITNNVEFNINKQQIFLNYKDITIKSKIIDGKYPNIETIIPINYVTTIEINKKVLQNVIERVTSISLNLEENIVRIISNKNFIKISSSVSEIANCEEKTSKFIIKGDPIHDISLNGRFLLNAIKSFDSQNIEVNFIDQFKPIVINEKNDKEKIKKNHIHLILPIRVY